MEFNKMCGRFENNTVSNKANTSCLIKHFGFGIIKNIHLIFTPGIALDRIPVNWAPDEPNNVNGNEDCLIFHPNGTFADVDCRSVYPFFCFKKQTDDIAEMNECGTIDKGKYILGLF